MEKENETRMSNDDHKEVLTASYKENTTTELCRIIGHPEVNINDPESVKAYTLAVINATFNGVRHKREGE